MLQATRTRCIVRRIEDNKQTAGGIILKSTDSLPRCRVESTGSAVTDVAVGDIIMVDWGRVGKIDYAGAEDLFIVEQSNILGVFED